MTMSNINNGQFGDTTLTKVFVGGLAWETPKDAMREHFEKFGDILEAVIISDKFTGRSKGYGFVTFKDAEAAKKACEDATPVINGRRANCNLACLGARRPRASSSTPPQQWSSQNYKIATDVAATDGATNIGPRSTSNGPTNQVPWYYPVGTPASPFHHQHHQAVPYYGYSPTYVTTDMSYNHKLSYNGGSYMNGHFSSQMYHHGPPPMVGANTLMPMYPLYHFHQPQTIGLPAHMYSPTTAAPITPVPALISKPISITPPNSVCLAVE